MKKSESVVAVCDCGCKTPISPDTETTHYGKLIFIFGHETLNLFDEVRIVSSEILKPKNKNKKKGKKKTARKNRPKQLSIAS
jgi:hypothetical protein